MIGTILKISVTRLLNSKQDLLLIFVVPILFFSIFAMIFSRGVGSKVKTVSVSIVNDDPTPQTAKVIQRLLESEEVRRATGIGVTSEQWPIEKLARAIMSSRNVEVVVYFPAEFSNVQPAEQRASVQILNEGTNPVSSRLVEAALSKAILQDVPRLPLTTGVVSLASATNASPAASLASHASTSLPIEHHSVFASNKHEPKIAMYAAGIAVMFLLFSSIGAGASLLEEKEAGTLERLLSSRLSIGQLLIGKWLYIAILGFLQLTVMFVWGWLVFGVDLAGHWVGFAIISTATSAACASFALFLAVLCKSRTQLNGVALVVVLSMSALGGSMIPRYLMSESMQKLGRLTFNGWALDAYKKVFWYDLHVAAIKTEILVLLGIAAVLGLAARGFANQWSLR